MGADVSKKAKKTKRAKKRLTPYQEKFAVLVAHGELYCDAYAQAYTGTDKSKWSRNVLHIKGSETAAMPHVRERIDELRAAVLKGSELRASEILNEVRRLATSDIVGIVDRDGRVLMPHELDRETRAAVASFEISEDGTIKYRFWDKNAAIEKAAKHLGLYEQDNKQKTNPIAELIAQLSGNTQGIAPGANEPDDDDA